MGSGGIVGIFLFIFAALLGVGAHFLGANSSINMNGFAIQNIFPEINYENMTSIVFYLIESLGSLSPIVVGLLCLCVVAALQSTISAILMTSGEWLLEIFIDLTSIKTQHGKENY